MQRADAAALGRAPGEEHRRLVGIGAGLDEERAAERRIEGLRQAGGEAKLRLVEIDRARVGERAEAVPHRLGHARVVVADRRAHLARVEVQVSLAFGIEDLRTVGTDEDWPVRGRNHVREQLALDQMTRAGRAQSRDIHRYLPCGIVGRDPRAFPFRTETLQPRFLFTASTCAAARATSCAPATTETPNSWRDSPGSGGINGTAGISGMSGINGIPRDRRRPSSTTMATPGADSPPPPVPLPQCVVRPSLRLAEGGRRLRRLFSLSSPSAARRERPAIEGNE